MEDKSQGVEKLLQENGLLGQFEALITDLKLLEAKKGALEEQVNKFVEAVKKPEGLVKKLDIAAQELLEKNQPAVHWMAFSRMFMSCKPEHIKAREEYWMFSEEKEGGRGRCIAVLTWSRFHMECQMERLKAEHLLGKEVAKLVALMRVRELLDAMSRSEEQSA